MADKKLEYWYDWEIHDPNGNLLIRLKKSPPTLEEDKINDISYLCKRIKDYPDSTLMNSKVWYRITMLRQQAFKDEKAAAELEKICKAILGDGRKRKASETIKDLKNMISKDIIFFKEVLERNRNEEVNVEDAIRDYLTKGNENLNDAQLRNMDRKESNYETVYYAYKHIHSKLKSLMTDLEIYCFFEKAALNIEKTNATIDVQPGPRRLTFIKIGTWYTMGPDIHVELG